MKNARFLLIAFYMLVLEFGFGQGTAPTFRFSTSAGLVTLPGRDPAQGGTTVIPTILVPVRLEFDASRAGDKPLSLDAAADVAQILHSPVFSKAPIGAKETTQYMDAMLRATAGAPEGWHTLLAQPVVQPVTVQIPVGFGYVLKSKRTGTLLGMADAEYVQRAIFRQIPRQEGKLVIAVTLNTAYYTYGDATVCCSWGTHGVDEATGNSFVLASYLGAVPPLVEQRDVQPLTEQLAEWVKDPLHDSLFHMAFRQPLPKGENVIPSWKWPAVEGVEHRGCGGNSPSTRYTLQDPLDTNERSDLPAGPATVVDARGRSWHLADVALMNWYTGGAGPYSFPDARLLRESAIRCPASRSAAAGSGPNESTPRQAVAPTPSAGSNNGHELIGYWTGRGPGGTFLPAARRLAAVGRDYRRIRQCESSGA